MNKLLIILGSVAFSSLAMANNEDVLDKLGQARMAYTSNKCMLNTVRLALPNAQAVEAEARAILKSKGYSFGNPVYIYMSEQNTHIDTAVIQSIDQPDLEIRMLQEEFPGKMVAYNSHDRKGNLLLVIGEVDDYFDVHVVDAAAIGPHWETGKDDSARYLKELEKFQPCPGGKP